MSNPPPTTPQQKIVMLKHLLAGKGLDFVADVTGIKRDDVLTIVSNYGYPDVKRMSWAVDVLVKGGDKIPQRPVDLSHRPKVLLDEPTKPYQSAPSGAVNIPPSTVDLLTQAAHSEHSRTRALAMKIAVLLDDLGARLNDEQAAVEAKAQAAKENAAVTARIATLQAEIDKLKGKRAKTAKPAAVKGPRSERLTKGEHPCAVVGCARTFDTHQGVALHQRRAHAA